MGELAQLEHDRVAGPDRRMWWSDSLRRAGGYVAMRGEEWVRVD
jgi:hypothetical protein